MKKILLSIFLAISMLLPNISVMAEGNADMKYKAAVELLSTLNVISVNENNDDFSAETYVTREEFCVYVCRAFKIVPDKQVKQVFSDVPAESELAHYTSTLYEKGVVDGYGEEFRPRDIIDYNEAIKILVSIMSYDYADSLGGYPTGYLRIASSLGITEDVYDYGKLTKSVAAQLIYNALAAPIMEVIGIKDGSLTYKSNNDKSAFTELYNIYEGEGIVLASGNGALGSGAHSIENDEVLIADTFYKIGKTNVADLLGHYIEFLYLEIDKDEYEIINVLEDKGEELVISSNQNIRFSDNTYRYEDTNGKTKKVRLNDDYQIMYNFAYPNSGFNPNMMEPDMGRVKLVKSGKGSGYTAVIIEEYDNYVVDGIDADKEVIYSKEKTTIELKGKEYTILNAEGKPIEMSAIKEWNVVSVLISSDGKKSVIYVSDKETEGKATRIGNVSEPVVVIDSEEYYADTSVLSKIEFGKTAKFYFDYCGNIAGVSETYSDALRYAYLLTAKVDEEYGDSGDGRVYVKLFDQDGTEKKYYLAEKVRINDVLYKENNEGIINNGLSLSVNILKYQLNSRGEINNLYVYDGTSDKYIRRLHSGTAYWTLKQRSFGPKVTMESNAPVFVVPDGYGVEDYQVTGLSSFENDKTTNVSVYTMGDNVYGEVAVRDAIITNYTRSTAIVKKVEYMLDQYDDECVRVDLLYDGVEQQFVLEDEDILGEVAEGDVIKISLNHKKEIQAILHVYDASENEFLLSSNPYEPQSGAGFRSANRMVYGYAYDVTDGLMKYCKTLPTGNSIPDTENALLSAFKFYVIDGPEVYVGNENDLKDFTSAGNSCSRVIVQTMWWDPIDIIIIK